MAQFVGFSDVFGGLVDRIPDYLLRFSSFSLSLFRRVVGNPVGFVSVVIGTFLGAYEIDKVLNELSNSVEGVVSLLLKSVDNGLTLIQPPACGAGDIACYVESGLIAAGKAILSSLTYAFVFPIQYLVQGFLQFISYITKYNLYIIQSMLCYVGNNWFPLIAGSYTAFESFKHISAWMFRSVIARGIGSKALGVLGGLTAPIFSFIAVNTLSKVLLSMVFQLFGFNCGNIQPPTLNITATIPSIQAYSRSLSDSASYFLSTRASTSTPESTSESASYSISYSFAGLISEYLGDASSYSVAFSIASQINESISESMKYSLSFARAPFQQYSINEHSSYSLTALQAPPTVLQLKDSSKYGLSFSGVIRLSFTESESVSYSLVTLKAFNYGIQESLSYSLAVSGVTHALIAPPTTTESASYSVSATITTQSGSSSSVSGNTFTLTYTITLEGMFTPTSIPLQYNASDSYQS